MRKFALVALIAAALAVPGSAAAAAPQGKLTGSATNIFGNPFTISATDPVIDGGTSYVGLENDKSGNCNGDSGTIIRVFTFTVVCAHYVASSKCCNPGSPKMRLAFANVAGYTIVRITDNGASGDTFAFSTVDTFAQARAFVNKGAIGGVGSSWAFSPTVDGDYTVCGVCP
jgi:hypothetical protein